MKYKDTTMSQLDILQNELDFYKTKFSQFTNITISLQKEKDIDHLLNEILFFGREFTHADAGTLYIYDNNELNFRVIQNTSLGVYLNSSIDKVQWDPIKVNKENKNLAAVYCALHQTIVHIDDIYTCDNYDFSGTKSFDKKNNYRTKSMLVVPVIHPENQKLLGVLQLINKQDNDGNIISFSSEDKNLTQSLAYQSAAALVRLKGELEHLRDLNKQLEESQAEQRKLTQKNIEYGAFVQKSLLPSDNDILKSFDNFFIISNSDEAITSYNYNFLDVSEDIHIFYYIDFHDSGIKNAFYSMFLNGIEKELLHIIDQDDTITPTSQWIYDFFCSAIENQNHIHNKFDYDIGIICYDSSSQTISYTGKNTVFFTNQDDNIYSDQYLLEVDKEKQINMYLMSNRFYDVSEISNNLNPLTNEPFVKQKSKYEELFVNNKDMFFCGFQLLNKKENIIEFEGVFEQKLLGKFSDTIEDQIENIGIVSNLLTVVAEQFQNTMNYSKDETTDTVSSTGYICLQEDSKEFKVISTNIISKEDKEKIEPKFIEIQSLDRQGIRKRYKELRKSGANSHSKGGGIGLYEIAKRCNNIEYDFKETSSNRYLYTMTSIINK
jgi:hypothetical protein